ncbi:dynein axonemal heavy chain 1-like [Bombus pascuorum]|uniref:dynein axonemal heavy chain 1-like n=1 Tax=Bombus pascuorum TaxID=65598 RepID=UPI00298E5C0D|nr:dynein axonemal heavy chain 1-like [Bombus pascuorum]
MQQNVEPKRIPRNVEMERRRRLYRNLKIQDVLEEIGVSPKQMLPPSATLSLLTYEETDGLFGTAHFLPLEIFDDEEYDCRTVEDWINLGVIDGTRYPLPATVFVPRFRSEDETFSLEDNRLNNLFAWTNAAVTHYDRERKLWTVLTLDGRKRKFKIPRIYIRLFAEDPRIYAKRVAAAIEHRRIAEASIKYHFYLDCMLMEGMKTLNEEEKETIVRLATNNSRNKHKYVMLLMEEICLDYQRTMCDLTWRQMIQRNPEMFKFVTWMPDIEATRVPEKGKIDTGMTNFLKVRQRTHWITLYVHEEVYQAMACVMAECVYVSSMNLFAISYGKQIRLLEFEDLQTQAILTVIKYLKEPWLEKITQSVRMCLRDLGKGWFNLEQKNHGVYDVMKLKRFMNLTTLRMQYALRVLVENSIKSYGEILERPALCVLDVEESFAWGDDLIDTRFKPTANPVFLVDLQMDEQKAYYTTDPDKFAVGAFPFYRFSFDKDRCLKHERNESIVALYDNALAACHQIRQLHPFLLPKLKFPADLFLSSVGLLEDEVCKVRDRLTIAYKKSTIPLRAYAKEYSRYQSFFNLDIPRYIESYKQEELSTAEIKEEIAFHMTMKQNLQATLPNTIAIGPFLANVRPLKDLLMRKRHECATELLVMLTEKLRTDVDDILEEYTQIRYKLREVPQSIEHIFEIRDWMETIPLRVQNLEERMDVLKLDFDILDAFLWNISDEDFHAKWEVIGCPVQIEKEVRETNERLMEEQEKFYKIQLQDEVLLQERIDTLVSNVANIALQTDINRIHETALDVKRIWKSMVDCREMGLLLNERQKLFDMKVVPFDHLHKLMRDFEPYRSLWVTASDWLKWHDIWMDNPLMNVDGSQIDVLVADMHRAITRAIRTFQEFPKVQAIAIAIRQQMDEFKPYVSLIQALRDPGMKDRHFEQLSAQTGIQMALKPSITFKSLLMLGIEEFEELVKTVADTAAKEYATERTLNKMIEEWETIVMEILAYKTTGTYIIKVAEEITMLLENHILGVQQLAFSPLKTVFEDEITEWEYKLKLTEQVLILWIEVQRWEGSSERANRLFNDKNVLDYRDWMYLEPIFTSEDIKVQLPVETRKYNAMERNWRRIMKNAYENPYVIKICPDINLLESLQECQSLLEVVQKGLSNYLEMKRRIFPRFYFLSDEELLEILAQAKNVQAVQPHLRKCFENIQEVKFEEDLQITRMYSAEREEVLLDPPMYPLRSVEYWLGDLETVMRTTIRNIIGAALLVVDEIPRKTWVYMWPGQVTLCCGQTYWTAQVENGIRSKTLSDYYHRLLAHMEDLRELVRGPQTEIQRLMLEAVITIEVHARDVLYKLLQEKVSNVNDFDWISQLRYYWVDGELKVRAVNAEFPYGYEYLGNTGRLVITPLTDRCYLTLTGALHLKFGGAPAGPAGTGKTETTKDLAKAFAIQCVVFNCSDQLDFMSMGKFFKGLASAGAWACFDEFNRIDIEVLSVIAQQIMTIQQAQQMRMDTFIFEGDEIVLKTSCAVFITMNPGYAGRTELPDNLKALFRPVAMMVPDYSLIAEISLFSYGFSEAKVLAGKITTTFKLSSEQLSTQDHYDFGMRAVKTVIAVAGNLKREQKDLNEQQICLRALRDVNVPKFLKDDLTLFNGIVSDLFPRLEEKHVDHGVLETQIRAAIARMGLEEVNEFVKKVIQLYETTVVRHGLMLVGPTGSGKTRCYEVLKEACTKLKGQPQPSGKPFAAVITHVLNPKSITMGQLYGEYDLNTREWTDGIFSTLLRAGIAADDSNKRWYVFDGPVDALWIENMNTVLDDNKKLCLTSGEIMKILPTMTMMFEVADLRVASPATVSRCGMVYLEPEGLGLDPLVNCWLRRLPKNMSEYVDEIAELTRQFLFPGLKLLRNELREIVNTVDSGMVQSYVNLMNFRIGPMAGRDGKPPPTGLLSPWAAFAAVWSLGATSDYNSRLIFDEWTRKVQRDNRHPLPFPDDGLVFDYRLHDGGFTDPIDGQDPVAPRWYKWLDDVAAINITPEMKFAGKQRNVVKNKDTCSVCNYIVTIVTTDMEIPTMDSVRSATLIGYLLINDSNPLCVGPTGSGKTLTVTAKLSRNMPKKFICDFITFSARTSANQTQDLIDEKLTKRRKDVYGPPLLRQQIFFIDDLNMPALDTYGAQPPIELLRQFMDFRGWYDRKEIGSFSRIEDVNFVGAMGPPGGGRNPITDRLLRHFHFIAFPEMEDDAKRHIFGTILNAWLSVTPHFAHMLDAFVNSTLDLYTVICKQLLPTPHKSHYTYNVRDLGKVFQGMLMMNPAKIERREKLLLLWYHENVRVFSDRLVNEQDRKWFDDLLRDTMSREFRCDPGEIVGDVTLFFGDFVGTSKQYDEITDRKKMERVLEEFLEDYNATTTTPMKLVLFQDAMDHICRINRILRQPRGNALLLGMGGSGRQSLTRLASNMQDYACFQIELSSAYTSSDWRDDIKNSMMKAGVQNQCIVFLFSDTQIKDDSMLEDLNSVLNNGDVPNIYKADEMEKIFHSMRGHVQEAGLQINRSNLFSVYVKTVRNNLHVVVTMSPIGETFRARIRQFPALVNCCTIDWFCPWPEAALQSVAMRFLSEIQDESITEDALKSIVRMCQYMHSSVIDASDLFLKELNRYNYVTPTSYLELLSGYGDLLTKKKTEIQTAANRLATGLEKLANAETEVKHMQQLLAEMKPKLEEAARATARMIEKITVDTMEAEKTRARAKEQEAIAAKMKVENQAIRDEAEADLSEARPMLIAAEKSLKALNRNDITEVKAMKRPPVGVLLVIEAICIINNVKPIKVPVGGKFGAETKLDYWTPGSLMLSDPGHFLYTMENYDKENLTEEIINKLKPYIENPNFQPSKIEYVSKACHSLCLWVHAMYNYYFVNLKVKPKMEALAKAEVALVETEEALNMAIQRLREVEEGVEQLRKLLREEEERKAELEREKQLCEDRMGRAVRLIDGLAGEQIRWTTTVLELNTSLKNAVGDILLASGAIAYLTPFTDAYRQTLLSSWKEVLGEGVPHTPGSDPVSTLGDQVEIRRWQIEGLPRDTLSVENAVLAMHSNRWPLFIDPQAQANKWIRSMYKGNGISVARMKDKELLRVVESCVRFGRACLVENVGQELEAGLDPILLRSLFEHGGQWCVKVGENIVPYNPDFRLFLTTRLSSPRYTPEVCVKILLVNFALTATGLEDQMLSLVAIQERPDLEQARNVLIESNAEMRKELQQIEDRILYRLSVSEGSAVDDMDLILTLEASKVKSEQIKVKMKEAEITQVDIDTTRSLYIPVAVRARILFFCLSDLQFIDTMYQYSLEWFVDIFNNSILATEKSGDIQVRVANINRKFMLSLFSNVCRSLFEKHKLHFAFLVCARIRMNDNSIDAIEWRHLLSGAEPMQEGENPAPEWITPRCWKEIQALENLPSFHTFVEFFEQSVTRFKTVFDAQEAHLAAYPEPWGSKLDDFQKMLLLKCLRPDKVTNAMQLYLAKYLGHEFVEPQTTELSAIYHESSPTTPIVFVLSTGTDPAAELYKFADKLKMSTKLHAISLGQGQGPRAEAMLKLSAEQGYWCFFQNCHLAPSWMPELDSLVERLSRAKNHRDFRLWLTSAPSPDFPVSILQNSSKMTVEPPRGIKANMFRVYLTQVTEMQTFIDSAHARVRHFKWLVFSLCLFHSVLLERRKFGSLGFNIPYEFTDGDLRICISQLHMFLLEYDTVPFKVLIYTAGHINYGGRITDDWDRRCVLTILRDFYRQEILSSSYRFDEEGRYVQLPDTATFHDYIEYVKTFPLNDHPSMFGMHPNADISFAQAETYACLNTLLALQPRQVGAAAASVEEVTNRLAQDMLSTIPRTFDLAVMQQKYPVSYEESFNTVLLQEAIRYNGLLDVVKTTLVDLLKALKGLVVMSEHLEIVSNSLYTNRIPQVWQDKGYPSLKPLGAWFLDLKERIQFLRSWENRGIPAAFWISGFYFPQAFLTGTLQNFARKYVVSIDAIDFSFQVLKSIPEHRPPNGCVIYGLFLEGCRWDGNYLNESLPKELYTNMLPILLLPEVDHKQPEGIYVCPVYKTINRAGTLSTTGHSTNFVLPMEIPSQKPQAHWIKRGVALICALDY